jgi:excisionase family DNA binding protein
MPTTPSKVGLTVAEVAERTGKSKGAIRAMITNGELLADTSGAAWIVPIREVHRVWGAADLDALRAELHDLVDTLVAQSLAKHLGPLVSGVGGR